MTRHRYPVALLAVLAALTITAPAAQARPAQYPLPPPGVQLPLTARALDSQLQLRDETLSVDFHGGLRVRVEPNPDDPDNSRRLRLVGMRFDADLPEGGRQARQGGGSITIEQSGDDTDPQSVLRLTQQSPPRYENIMVVSFSMTIDQPGRAEPLVLTTKDPARLVGQLSQFPPQADIYQLQNPIDLVLPESPDDTVATLQTFPVKLSEA
ncbi:hypothetical protein [Amycolatopsis australiensis]|uniref:Uncharacterized protein n=1 Tax=Amycolatopsis australiensis TaxID=546364 RepID=A0A1K1RSD5_9PSEU|nr:hypothetical protein [Amycolatopsis australiensis]SFW74794.1 hypothetical protein SAMN04489730_3831 [Amycolatopsis australiensis]